MNKRLKKNPYVKKNRVILHYTEREWLLIEGAIERSGNRNGVASHIIKGINNLDKPIDITEENKKRLTKIKRREFYPPDNSYETLMNISTKLNLRPSTVVSRLIINPLLLKK